MLNTRFGRPHPASSFNQTVNQIFESAFADLTHGSSRSVRAFPALNAWEDAQNLYLEAELPGFRIEDLDITLANNELTISGKREDLTPEGATFVRRERASGSFLRTLRISTDVDAANVGASLINGVLTITLPKAEAAKPRKISVKTN